MAVSDDDEVKMIRLAMYAVATVVIIFFLTVGGCTMHGHAYEAEVEAEVTKQIEAKAIADQMRIKALKDLIDSGVNPIAAHCAIEGWSNADAGRCERSAEEK